MRRHGHAYRQHPLLSDAKRLWRASRSLIEEVGLGGCSLRLRFLAQFDQLVARRPTLIGEDQLLGGTALGVDHQGSLKIPR